MCFAQAAALGKVCTEVGSTRVVSAVFRAQNVKKSDPEAPDGFEMIGMPPQEGPTRSKMAKDEPEQFQDGTKLGQDGAKMAQDAFQTVHVAPKLA